MKLNGKIVNLLQSLTQGNKSRRQATAEKVEALETELHELREQLNDREYDEENAQLRTVLGLAKEKLAEQNAVLEQLTATPLAHAVVLYVDEMEVTPLVESLSLQNLEPGMMVRVLVQTHPFTDKVGRVVRGLDGDGDILVNVGGNKMHVRVIQKYPPKAEPLEGSADDFASFAVGKEVKVVAGDYAGKTGKIVQALDGDGDIRVKFDDNSVHYVRVGKIFGKALEIIAAPSQWANSVVVAYEGKRLEVRYPQELLQAMFERGNYLDGKPAQEFHIGDRVRIRGDSKFNGQDSGAGEIKAWSRKKGWAEVEFESGYDNNYRIGDPGVEGGACDLELVDQPMVAEQDDGLSNIKFLEPGDIVKLSLETMQIVAVVDRPRVSGEIAFVRNLIDTDVVEVEYQGSTRVVHNGNGKVETGDRVVLDPTTSIILRNLGKEDTTFSFNLETQVTWESIGGLVEAKDAMIEAIELPFQYPDLYRNYNKKPIKGVLLYGPPGCGKTMLGKATATALARIHQGVGTSSGFLYIKGPEILDRFVGSAETTIRQIFQRSRKHKETHGYPAVIFIDEADAIFGRRGIGISSDVERTIVPMFLAEMDGMEDSGAFLLLATNRPDVLDSAVTRDGRIDRKIRVGRPDVDGARDIFQLYLSNVPIHNGYTVDELAEKTAEELFIGSTYGLYTVCLKKTEQRRNSMLTFSLRDLCSGAMIAGIVDQATSIALRRDMASGTACGISLDDLVAALHCVYRENFYLSHAEALAEFTHDFREDVVEIKKLTQAYA